MLEPSGYSETVTPHRARTLFPGLILGLLLLTLCTSCSMPRIVTLKDPLTPEEHLNLGVAYERNGELELAVREYKAAVREMPLAYLYLGNAHFLKNDLRAAEDYYKRAIEKVPGHADAYNNLAWVYYVERRDLDEAERLVHTAMGLNPEKAQVYMDTLEKIRVLKNP